MPMIAIQELPPRLTTPQRTGVRRAVVAATLGTVIEWFDYALYGSASGLVINKLFFPQFSPVGAVLAAFATFAVGFFIRPLGGIVIAHLGDRFGRKPALIFAIVLMGVATASMGLLPTYGQIGITAAVLLVALRLLQGFGAGAEYAGAVTLVSEYAPLNRRGVMTALLQSATLVGVMLSTLAFLAVSTVPEKVLLSWAWRVPFLSSSVMFAVALFISNRLHETPEYIHAMERASKEHTAAKVPLRELIKHSPKELLFAFLAVTGHNATAYILGVFALSYMTNTLGLARIPVLSTLVISTTVGIVMAPLMGALADRLSNATVYLFGAAFMMLFAFPFFLLLNTRDITLITVAMSLGYGLGFGAMGGAQGALLANLFPTRYRFSGIALSRELNGLLIAGPTPFVATALVAAAGGRPNYVALYVLICCTVSIFATWQIMSRQREIPTCWT
jgi:MFS transporter, MHS family, shikimate and dehydroshikimate transport protein